MKDPPKEESTPEPQDTEEDEDDPAPQASREEETEVPAHAISRPADWDPDEEEPSDEELERDLLFSKKLHQVIQMRRDRAEELRGQKR